MGQEIKVTGLVLQTGNIGEYDKRVVLLTKERGRISAFARGAKKATSSFAGVCQPFTFGTFTLYEGKKSFNLMWADVDHYFEGIKNDLERIYYASYFSEFASYLTRENNDEVQILKLLYASLRALEKGTIPKILIRAVYEIKLMAAYGEGISVFSCVTCGSKENLHYFDERKGGVLCEHCKETGRKELKLKESTLYTLQYILSSPIERLYTFKVSDAVQKELESINKRWLKQRLDVRFKSLEFIEFDMGI